MFCFFLLLASIHIGYGNNEDKLASISADTRLSAQQHSVMVAVHPRPSVGAPYNATLEFSGESDFLSAAVRFANMHGLGSESIRPLVRRMMDSSGLSKSATMCIITAVSGNYKACLESIDHLHVDGFVFGGGTNVVTRGTRWIRDGTHHFRHADPFMEAKYYKTQWHKIPRLEKYDIVVWMDATLILKKF